VSASPPGGGRRALGIGLQLTGLALCPLALAYGFADQGPSEWGLLLLGVLAFVAGTSLARRNEDPGLPS